MNKTLWSQRLCGEIYSFIKAHGKVWTFDLAEGLFEKRFKVYALKTSPQCFREPAEGQDDEPLDVAVEEEFEETESDPQNYIVCRQCLQIITSEEERTIVNGLHRHTFANPNGIVFDIGCFNNAVGCGFAGHWSTEFTWFAGFSWRILICGMCLTHLGWMFESGSGSRFYGLIMDRLLSEADNRQ